MSYDNKPRPPTPGWPDHDPKCSLPVDHKGYCVISAKSIYEDMKKKGWNAKPPQR